MRDSTASQLLPRLVLQTTRQLQTSCAGYIVGMQYMTGTVCWLAYAKTAEVQTHLQQVQGLSVSYDMLL